MEDKLFKQIHVGRKQIFLTNRCQTVEVQEFKNKLIAILSNTILV